ncbi:MAG: NAD(P)-dependent oxidoreductase [Candidatus Diapherotrites archaeon]|nr:NAD(P)-dependent oxidoreductase [Candidatus Diapherotrites archaeon]
MPKSILVTGGAGYVGYTVVERLAKKYPRAKIIIFDNFSKGKIEGVSVLKKRHKNIVLIPWEKADIRSSENVEAVFRQYKPDVVVHLAAIVDAFATNLRGKDLECRMVNQNAAIELAKIAKRNGTKIFVFQCSVSIYSRGVELKEPAEKAPLSTYGKTKMIAERKIISLSDDSFKVISLRPATVVGFNPCFRFETIINLVCARSVYGVPTRVFESALRGDKTYLHLKDNAAAILFAIEHKDTMNGRCFNVTSFHTNLEEVLKIVKKYLKEDFAYEIVREKSINQQVYTINSDKIKGEGFKPKGNLDEAVKEMIQNLKKIRNFYNNLAK